MCSQPGEPSLWALLPCELSLSPMLGWGNTGPRPQGTAHRNWDAVSLIAAIQGLCVVVKGNVDCPPFHPVS